MAAERRPMEQEAVRTTIVGGRPPGSGKPLGPIPRGIEVLVKKAAVDPEFKRLLLENRGEAAREIGLVLDPAETMMLAAAPQSQLEAIIAQTTVAPSIRPAFLGRAAAVMLVALGAGAVAGGAAASYLADPNDPSATTPAPTPTATPTVPFPPPAGIPPDRPLPSRGMTPDRPPVTSTAPAPTVTGAPTATAAAISKEDADAMKTRIEKEYQATVLEAIRTNRGGGVPINFTLSVGAKGAVETMRYFNASQTGTPELRNNLTRLVRAWKFPGLNRAGAATVMIETAAEEPAAAPATIQKPGGIFGLMPDPPAGPPAVKLVSLTVLPGVVEPPAPAVTPTVAPTPTAPPVAMGIKPDRPPTPTTPGVWTVTRPEPPQNATLGIQPDRP